MIMTCPKCGGSGEIIVDTGKCSTAAPYKSICPSCTGLGYVTDQPPIEPIKEEK